MQQGNAMDAAQTHEMGEILEQIRVGVVHDQELQAARLINKNNPVVYDVGANRGQSIVSFKLMFPEATIHSFELNPLFHPVLDEIAAKYPNTQVHKHGLSDTNGEVEFFIPIVNGVLHYEEASIDNVALDRPWVRDRLISLDPNFQVSRHRGTVQIGDELGLPAPDIIKIDVEGVELRVVKGFIETINASKPLVIVENSDWKAVTDLLGTLGYKPYRFDAAENKLIDFHGQTTNTFYIASDHDRGMLAK